jgi:hypothetical protein
VIPLPPPIDHTNEGLTLANHSGASETSTRIDAFSVLGRFVVRAPWPIIAAWTVVVGVLAVAFPPLMKVVESQTVQPLPPKRHGGRRADGQGFR